MNDAWDERRKAQEEQYFEKQNKDALSRIKTQEPRSRPSPISGKPMEQVTMFGVNVDRCLQSGGIWLDAGELEQILKNAAAHHAGESAWFSGFLKALFQK